jgi:hypothetical protein
MRKMLLCLAILATLSGCMKVNCAIWQPAGYYCPPALTGGK